MIALSVVSPAGSRIRTKQKIIEVRDWRPDNLPLSDLIIVQNDTRLSSNGVAEDPNGRVVAVVDVIKVRPWIESDMQDSCASYFEDGWLAWELSNIRKANYPGDVPAKLRLYDLDIDESMLKRE